VIALLYRATDRKQFRWDAAARIQFIPVTILFAIGVTASVFCCANGHRCMGGHMEHPPYAMAEYVSDASWAGGLIFGVALLGRVRSPATALSAVLVAFLLSLRFIFGSIDAFYPVPL
jgi:hypothetical protein